MAHIDCTDFKVSLSGYLDGTTSIETRMAVDRHLLECRPCRDLFDQAERNDLALRALCRERPELAEECAAGAPLPTGFERAVLSRVRRHRPVQWRRVYDSLALLATAAAIALGTALVFVLQAGGGGENPSSRTAALDGWERMAPGVYGPPRPPRELLEYLEPRAILPLTFDDVQALASGASTLEAMESMPFEDIAGRGRLRDAVRYDELIRRLGAVRHKLDPAACRLVDAASAALFLLDDDRSDVERWSRLRQDLALLGLPEALDRLVATATDHAT